MQNHVITYDNTTIDQISDMWFFYPPLIFVFDIHKANTKATSRAWMASALNFIHKKNVHRLGTYIEYIHIASLALYT